MGVVSFGRSWGVKSFARFYDLSIEEVYQMAEKPNDIFYDMIIEMTISLNHYEDFMVKVKRLGEKEQLTRTDLLDL